MSEVIHTENQAQLTAGCLDSGICGVGNGEAELSTCVPAFRRAFGICVVEVD